MSSDKDKNPDISRISDLQEHPEFTVGMLVAVVTILLHNLALAVLIGVTERYHKAGLKCLRCKFFPDCRQLLKNAERVIDVNIIEDPTYHVAVDKLA